MHENTVEFEVFGDYALFSDPVTRVGGEKCSYQIPTYEAVKGVLQSLYWKPTIIWYIDEVRVMNQIQMETKGIRTLKYNGGNDLSYYTYLRDCRYKVRAHFEFNKNRDEQLKQDQNRIKHLKIALRSIEKGGRRDVFLGTRECQAYVVPTVFDEGDSFYKDTAELHFGFMYHGITYADEAYDDVTKGNMTVRFWNAVMKNGTIHFPKPCDTVHRVVKKMDIKPFGEGNFIGLKEFENELKGVE